MKCGSVQDKCNSIVVHKFDRMKVIFQKLMLRNVMLERITTLSNEKKCVQLIYAEIFELYSETIDECIGRKWRMGRMKSWR